tara:strand:- start:17394 stop:19469 length:2076 start_codon:yes stop_codon:yes gene_type:complete
MDILDENTIVIEEIKNKTILNDDPLVYTIDNFITNEECEHFINLAKPNLQQALVSSNEVGKRGIVSKGRSGSNYWVPHKTDILTETVGERIANFIGVPLNTSEQFQVIHYDVSEEYRQHHDSWDHDASEKAIRCMKYGGQRLFTALVYLNDVEKGGGTKFTRLNIEVEAKKGRLLFFENVHKNTNKKQYMSEHAGMPVIEGEKWAFNLWFREKPRSEIVYDPKPAIVESDDKIVHNESNVAGFNYMDDSKEQTVKSEFISQDELMCFDGLCKQKLGGDVGDSRKTCWIQNYEIISVVDKISKLINIDKKHFENINVVRYPAQSKHNNHFDAYDFSKADSEKHMKTRGLEGQRIITITGCLSKIIKIKFPETTKEIELKRGDLLIYKNTIQNTTSRNIKMRKAIENNTDDAGLIFHVYVREKNAEGNTIPGIKNTFVKNIEPVKNTPPKFETNEDFNETLLTAYETVKNKKPYKSFTFMNKVNWPSVLSTLEKLKDVRDPTTGFLYEKMLNADYIFDEYTPVLLNNVIKPEALVIFQDFIRTAIKNNEFVLGDKQSNRFKARDETITRFLHYEILPLIRKITNKNVKPTYTYLACYTKDADLPAHTDQPDCEYTVSFILDKPEGANWPIYLDKIKQPVKNKGRSDFTPSKDRCISCDCDAGGLMIFNGTDHIHYREACEYDYYNVVLLHYRV